jgi:dipeptide/tripeptide permease
MGVNAGAFIGIMLCGWVGEKIGWSFGFGSIHFYSIYVCLIEA